MTSHYSIYPGSFNPPTRGHLALLIEACDVFEKVVVVCSSNEVKAEHSTDVSKKLWQSYALPNNCTITTLEEFLASKPDLTQASIVRGVRDKNDYIDDYDNVVAKNLKMFNINKYCFIVNRGDSKTISASGMRSFFQLATTLYDTTKLVSCLIATSLLENKFALQNLVMITGKPGSGKSTILKKLCTEQKTWTTINTDLISRDCNPVVLNRSEFVTQWLEKLYKSIAHKAYRGYQNMFIEIPYGLNEDRQLYKYVGGKVINISTGDDEINKKRLKEADRAEHSELLKFFPTQQEIDMIALSNGLRVKHFINNQDDIDLDVAEIERLFTEW